MADAASSSNTDMDAKASATNGTPEFDIVATYRDILATDPDINMPVAAIEALVKCMGHHEASTSSETLVILQKYTDILRTSIPNSISLSAGTDLFQRYLLHLLSASGAVENFEPVRRGLVENGMVFVENAKAARRQIAEFGRHLIKDGATVLTNGGSRVVSTMLKTAAASKAMRFKVVFVFDGSEEGKKTVEDLRAHEIPVVTIPASAVAYSLEKVDMMIVGAEGVTENGGVISRLGTYQIALLAKAKSKPFYVVSESHKFVRLFPLSQFDLPIQQNILDFKVAEKEGASETADEAGSIPLEEAVDFTVCLLVPRTVSCQVANCCPAPCSHLWYHHRGRRSDACGCFGGDHQDLVLSPPTPCPVCT